MLHELLQPTLDTEPDRPLVEFEGRQSMALELETAASTLAARFRQVGLEPIDRVAMLLPNGTEAVEVFLACFKGGFVIVPLDYRHRASQSEKVAGGGEVLVAGESRARLEWAAVAKPPAIPATL